jgi:hypothetical protein
VDPAPAESLHSNPTNQGVQVRKSSTHLAVAAALIATACAAVPAADAAAPKTGTWRGDLAHEIPPLAPGGAAITYKSRMVISEYEGRIQTVVATVRMSCPALVAIRDVRVVQSWRTGLGPRVSRRGSFAFRADGAYFHGTLSKSSTIGGASASYGEECHGVGRFNLQRRH